MNRVAIYARRSTEEHQAASLSVQIEEATRFCLARGWVVVETYQEDAVSRAEFVKRPALIRMLNGARDKVFDLVVMRDETRLGGDLYRTGMVLQDLHDAGIRLHYYSTGEAVSFDDPTSKLMAAVKLYASELERIKIASRTREHLEARARKGANVGGRVYGYDNVEVMEGERRVRVEYRINETEAEIVREVFRRYAYGDGLRTIAHDFNRRGVAPPRAGRRGTGSWSINALHCIVHRERYRGVLIWGAVGSTYRGGTRVAVERPVSEQIRVEREDLRIVSEPLWREAQGRRHHIVTTTGTAHTGRHRYLLSGLARCGSCGGPMQVSNTKAGQTIIRAYLCGWARDRGAAVCVNSLRRPVDELDSAVVGWIQHHLLTDTVLNRVLEGVRRALVTPVGINPEVSELEGELRRLHAEVGRYTLAIGASDEAPESLVRALVDRERRAADVRARLGTLARQTTPTGDWHVVERELRERFGTVRGMFAANGAEGRKALESVLEGPLRCTAVEVDGRRRYQVAGRVTTRGLTAFGDSQTVSDPNGFGTEGLSTAMLVIAGSARAA